jgi:hypothetical protein
VYCIVLLSSPNLFKETVWQDLRQVKIGVPLWGSPSGLYSLFLCLPQLVIIKKTTIRNLIEKNGLFLAEGLNAVNTVTSRGRLIISLRLFCSHCSILSVATINKLSAGFQLLIAAPDRQTSFWWENYLHEVETSWHGSL